MERPDPEVPERARRRTFTAKYKLEILAAYDAAPDGEKGALLLGRACTPAISWRGGEPATRGAGWAGGSARASAARSASRADRPS